MTVADTLLPPSDMPSLVLAQQTVTQFFTRDVPLNVLCNWDSLRVLSFNQTAPYRIRTSNLYLPHGVDHESYLGATLSVTLLAIEQHGDTKARTWDPLLPRVAVGAAPPPAAPGPPVQQNPFAQFGPTLGAGGPSYSPAQGGSGGFGGGYGGGFSVPVRANPTTQSDHLISRDGLDELSEGLASHQRMSQHDGHVSPSHDTSHSSFSNDNGDKPDELRYNHDGLFAGTLDALQTHLNRRLSSERSEPLTRAPGTQFTQGTTDIPTPPPSDPSDSPPPVDVGLSEQHGLPSPGPSPEANVLAVDRVSHGSSNPSSYQPDHPSTAPY